MLTGDNIPPLYEQDQSAIEFISTELGLPAGGRILDLCCGPGRFAIPLASKGFTVVLIDINEDYIALAKRVVERKDVAIEFLVGDAREVPFVNHFDAVINVGTSLGFFDDEDNQRVLNNIAKALKHDGVFLLHMRNREYLLKHQHFGVKTCHKLKDGRIQINQELFDYVRGRSKFRAEILF